MDTHIVILLVSEVTQSESMIFACDPNFITSLIISQEFASFEKRYYEKVEFFEFKQTGETVICRLY